MSRESDLRSKNHDRFAAAMVCCQSADPSWCTYHGRCRMDGHCFGHLHEPRELREMGDEDRIAALECRVAELERQLLACSGEESER